MRLGGEAVAAQTSKLESTVKRTSLLACLCLLAAACAHNGAQGPAKGKADSLSVAGDYAGTYSTDNGFSGSVVVHVDQTADGTVSGTLHMSGIDVAEATLAGSLTGDQLTGTITRPLATANFTATAAADGSLSGTFDAVVGLTGLLRDHGQFSIAKGETTTVAGNYSGNWTSNNQLSGTSTVTLEQSGSSITGSLASDGDVVQIASIRAIVVGDRILGLADAGLTSLGFEANIAGSGIGGSFNVVLAGIRDSGSFLLSQDK
jgi:hypothetical protein